MGARALAGFLIVGCAVGGTVTADQRAPAAEDEAVARTVVADLAARRFEAVTRRFDRRVAEALPAQRLADVWDGLIAQVGKLQAVEGVTRSEYHGTDLVHVTCRFEKAELELLFGIDAQKRVSTFRIVPAGSGSIWEPPAYARPDRFTERAATVGNAPWALPGTLTLPQGKGPFPAVVLVHGSGPHDQDESIGPNKDFKDLAWGLASRGIAVVRYVKRTKQYGSEMKDLPDLTVNQETVDDARAAVALAASVPEIDAKQIYVAGHSLGGYLAPRIAAGDAQVAGLIVLAGNTRPLQDLIIEQLRNQASLTPNPSAQLTHAIGAAEQSKREIEDPNLKAGTTLRVLGASIPASYFLDLRGYHPAEVAASLDIPILIVQGERDVQVRMADFEGWKKALAGRRRVTFKSYPALNHLFMSGTGPSTGQEYLTPGHVAEELVADIAAWILKTSAARPPRS
jgi:uncharacterized protein